MSQISYIRAAGDPDYNFAYSDFTVEFFVESSDDSGVQTLFEIANNESAAANLYTQTRFFTAIENGNLNAYAIQTVTPFIVGAGLTTFTSPTPISINDRIFYDGQFLSDGEYTVSGNTITLLIAPNNFNDVLVEIGQVLFDVQGQPFTTGNVHYVSAERFQNQFYLFLDGQSQSAPVPAFNAIPTQVITNTVGTGNLARYGSPALLTIGANKNGKDALFGKFGDFKITNGVSRHVQSSQIQQTISSQFTDANLGTQYSSIVIEGGGFVDTDSSYTPEELVPGQIFDTLYMQVYQNEVNFSNTIIAIDGRSVPYRSGGGINANYAFSGDGTGVNPSVVNVTANSSVTIQYLDGLWSISNPVGGSYGNAVPFPYGSWDANGNPYEINPGLPSTPLSGNSAALVGGWATSTGQLVSPPFFIGNNFTGTVPVGATQIQLGMNDGSSLSDNSGSINVAISQATVNVSNVNVLSFSLFKPTIMAGPTGSYSFTIPSDGSEVTLPWTSLDAAAASVIVNGNAIPSTQWGVFDSVLTIVAGPGDNVSIISTGPTNYYDVSNSTVSTITTNLYANSTSINVANTDPFITPIIGSMANTSNSSFLNVRGQVFVNQECITYLYIDRVANTLSGLMRGTSGTGVPAVHIANSRIVSASYTNDIQYLAHTDPRTAIWYSIPLNGTSLQDTNTAISTVLVNSGGLPPVTPF